MRCFVFTLPLAAAAVVIAAYAQEEAGRQPQRSQVSRDSQDGEKPQQREPSGTDEEPLLLEDEPPLLLDDGDEEPSQTKRPVADNSRCHVCHLDYVKEDIAVVHARANIGCADCHGDCDEHIADESWASGGKGTPPGKMYRRKEVNAFCTTCHAKDKIDKIDNIQHKLFFAGTAKEKYCTDCHGDHRLGKRMCKWK